MIAALLRGELPRLCQLPDGRLTSDEPSPRALVCGSFNPIHRGHQQLLEVAAHRFHGPVAYELAVVNADKPSLHESTVRRRLSQFEWLAPVWLTRAATFVAKARLFPGTTFVVGADTADRVIQSRFYGGHSAMGRALAEFREYGSRFLVGGRLGPDGRFHTCDDLSIAADIRDLFDAIPESDFRIDLSSTTIRNTRP